MFFRVKTLHNKDGSARHYLELVVNRRIGQKVRQERLCSLGRLDQLQEAGVVDRLIGGLARFSRERWVWAEGMKLESAWSKVYGPALVFHRLWQGLGLHDLVAMGLRGRDLEFPVGEAVFGMVLARLLEPQSKRGTHAWLREEVYRPELETVELHHLYRALDFLAQHKEALEEGLFARTRDLFSLEVDLVMFDSTSSYFEGKGPLGLGEFGYSRDHRPDLRQMVIGLLMTRGGLPIAHQVFPGNTADMAAFRQALRGLRQRFPIRRIVMVADRGVVSELLLEELEQEGMGYILGMPLRRWKEVREEVLGRPGRYHEVEENLWVKEVGVEGHRYIVCHNPQEEEADRQRRSAIIEQLRLRPVREGPKGLVVPRGLRRLVEVKGLEMVVKEAALKEEARYDGKWVVRTNTRLPPGEVAQAYKGLWRVEAAFRELKTGLEVRPIYHWTEERVRGHVAVCFLALVMEAALARMLKAKGNGTNYQKVLRDLETVKAMHIDLEGQPYLVRTQLPGAAYQAFQAVGLKPPPQVVPLS